MIAPFKFLNNPHVDSFSLMISRLINSGMLKSCGFFKKNENTALNRKDHEENGRTEIKGSSDNEEFKLTPLSANDDVKRPVGRPVEHSAFYKLKLLLIYTFTGAVTLGNFFSMPISKACSVHKTVVYDFISNQRHNWKKLLLMVATKAIGMVKTEQNEESFSALICDDSNIHRRRAKHVELSAMNFDHVEGKNTKGFLMMPISWTNGDVTLPCNLSLISSSKTQNVICQKREGIDNRTIGGKRRLQATTNKTDVVVDLVKECLDQGISAKYFMTDSWFTCINQLVLDIYNLGLDYIGMDKNFSQYYLYNGEKYHLNDLKQFMVSEPHCTNKDILGHTAVKIPPCVKKAKKMTAEEYNTACIHAKIVWLKARGSKDKVIAILCTDLSLSDEEVIRYYSARFNIEFGFFNMKHFLNLESGSRATNYDSVFCHVTMACIQLIIMTLLKFFNEDNKTIGTLYRETTDSFRVKPLADLIQKIVTMVTELPDKMIAKGYIVKGKEREFARDVLLQLKSILKGISLYVADFILDTIDKVQSQFKSLVSYAKTS